MFELHQYQSYLRRSPSAAPEHSYTNVQNVEKMSLLAWGEHCVECAAPSCYKTCDLYQPRPDRRCRRFAYGMYKNTQFPSLRGYGAEVVFKKWGQLSARGNTALANVASLQRRERMIQKVAPILDAVGSFIYRLTGDIRWNYPSFALLERLGRRQHARFTTVKVNDVPDAFLLEVYNPNPETVNMQLAMRLAKSEGGDLLQIKPSFVTTVSFPPGYFRYQFERRLFQAVTECGLPFDISITPEADNSVRLVFLTADFVRFKPASPAQQKAIKCLVFDLDQTLWDGVLIEDDKVLLKPAVREMLRLLDERGILLSIASKNSHEQAWKRLQEFGIADYFLYPQISWIPKSQGIKTIAERLNIGLDTLAFVDDSSFELKEVAHVVPEVTVINAVEIPRLLSDPRLQGSRSGEARQRRRYYREAIAREEKQSAFGSDYLGFLADCRIQLEIKPYIESDRERVSELVQRTNQLNFSGRKYAARDLAPILQDPGLEKFVLACSDRYGDYGTVGFSIVRQERSEIRIEDFMLSCRVQGKLIEQAFFQHLLEHHNVGGATRLWINFQETVRNKPAQQVLEKLNFAGRPGEPGLFLDLASSFSDRDLIKVNCTCSQQCLTTR